MSEPYDRETLQPAGDEGQDAVVGDERPAPEPRSFEPQTPDALNGGAGGDEELQADDGGPQDVPSTTDERLAERLDPNRHHAGEPEGLATMLQPGGVIPGGGPGATEGSIGTGGGSTGGDATGDLARGGR